MKNNTRRGQKASRAASIAVTAVSAVIFAMAVAVFAVVLIARSQNKEASFFGYSFAVVVTDSMEPEIMTGSLIIIKNCEISADLVGENVIFISRSGTLEGERIVHKVIESFSEDGEIYLVTKGVKNEVADTEPVTAENFVGVCVGVSYAAGVVVSFLASYGVPLAIAIIAVPIIVRQVIVIVKTLKSSDEEE